MMEDATQYFDAQPTNVNEHIGPAKGSKKYKEKNKNQAPLTTPVDPPVAVSVPSVAPAPHSEPETQPVRDFEPFLNGVSGLFDDLPEFFEKTSAVTNDVKQIIQLNPMITAALVAAVAGLIAYSTARREE